MPQKVWERFVQGLTPLGPVPRVILGSWHRSKQSGVHPEVPLLHRIEPAELEIRQRRHRELVAMAEPELRQLSLLLPQPNAAYLTDPDGIVLCSVSTTPEMIDLYGLAPGFDWSEKTMGTNGAGTALATGEPVAVIGCEHYCSAWHDAACMAAPLHSLEGDLLGAIDITIPVQAARPLLLAEIVRTAAELEQRLQGRPAVEPGSGESVLIVEDRVDDLAALGMLIELFGFKVLSARGGEEALNKCVAFNPGLVLLDILMPNVDGIEVCWRLKANPLTAQIPIVAVSGYAPAEAQARAAGASDFLLKPFHPNELLDTLKARLKGQPPAAH